MGVGKKGRVAQYSAGKKNSQEGKPWKRDGIRGFRCQARYWGQHSEGIKHARLFITKGNAFISLQKKGMKGRRREREEKGTIRKRKFHRRETAFQPSPPSEKSSKFLEKEKTPFDTGKITRRANASKEGNLTLAAFTGSQAEGSEGGGGTWAMTIRKGGVGSSCKKIPGIVPKDGGKKIKKIRC